MRFLHLNAFIYSIQESAILNSKFESMDSMIERWKESINSFDEKLSSPPLAHPRHTDDQAIKKSLEKSKRSLHSHEAKTLTSKRMGSAHKKKPRKTKAEIIESAREDIIGIWGRADLDKNGMKKITSILQSLWAKAIALEENEEKQMLQLPTELEISSMHESSLSCKKQEKLYQELERKYFECEKERQFLKSKAEGLIKKYEEVDRELERYGKMEKLIDSCLEREEEMRKENKKLKQDVQLAELREVEQQRIFQKEIMVVHELVESIRNNLPAQ